MDLRFASARYLEIVCGTIATPTSARIVERVTVGSTSACRTILRSSLLVVFLVAPDPVFYALVPRDPHNGAQRINPENRVGSSFRIIPEQYFSGIENKDDFLENIDHNLAYYEIPAQLACAYLKGHLKGRALDWFEVLGYRVIEYKTTDYAHLKQALSEQFPVDRNRSELETRFYSSSQRRDQQPSDFIYELLKIHKVLKLEMSEEKLIDHVVSRLEPQILDYVEVRHPRNTANLLQIFDKYERTFYA
ncbi:uncharacterized protein TNCV_3274411 [Trichonephila clavipes]|nr:uncharacterized protein TNCV_3274411 [Trichonephila clavipes]